MCFSAKLEEHVFNFILTFGRVVADRLAYVIDSCIYSAQAENLPAANLSFFLCGGHLITLCNGDDELGNVIGGGELGVVKSLDQVWYDLIQITINGRLLKIIDKDSGVGAREGDSLLVDHTSPFSIMTMN